MLKKTHVGVIVGIATAIWAVVLLLRGQPVTFAALGSFFFVVSGTFGAVWLFDRHFWPCRVNGRCVFHGWLVACPDIRGTWEVELLSSWVDPQIGQRIPPIRCYYGIRQTCTTLEMHLMTPESESWLVAHRFLSSNKTHGYSLAAVYTNEPDAFLRGVRSEIHRGAFLYEFHGPDSARPETFTGDYWTGRGTKGTVTARRISERVVTKHEDGLAISSGTAS